MSQGASRWQAPLMLVLATAFWSLSFPIMKAVTMIQQEELPGASTWFSAALCMAYRFIAASIVMALWSFRTLRQLTRSEISEGVGLGLFSSLGLILQMDGLAYTAASTSAFLTQCYCILIPIWLGVRTRRWPSPAVLVSCGLVIVGVAALSGVDWRAFRLGRGEAETLLASVVFTGQILWLQRPRNAANRVNHFTLVMFVVIAAICLPLAWMCAARPVDLVRAYATPVLGGFMVVLILFCTLGGYLLMNAWQPRVSTTQAGLIYCVEPVFASAAALVLPGWISRLAGVDYPNETLRSSLLLGGGLITLANVLIHAVPEPAPPTVAIGAGVEEPPSASDRPA